MSWLSKKLEETVAQINPFDSGQTASTIKKGRRVEAARTKRLEKTFSSPEWKGIQRKANQRNVDKLQSGQVDRATYDKQMQSILGNGAPIKNAELSQWEKRNLALADAVAKNDYLRPTLTGLASLSPGNAVGETVGYVGRGLSAAGWDDGKYLAQAGDNVADYSRPTEGSEFANQGIRDSLISGGIELGGDVINRLNPVTNALTMAKYFSSPANDLARGIEGAGYSPQASFGAGTALAIPTALLERASLGTIGGKTGGAVANAITSKIPSIVAKNTAAKVTTRLVGSGITEGVTEGAQEYIANLAANKTYDPERSLTQGVGESMLVGGLLGAGARGGVEIGSNPRVQKALKNQAEFTKNSKGGKPSPEQAAKAQGQLKSLYSERGTLAEQFTRQQDAGKQDSANLTAQKIDEIDNDIRYIEAYLSGEGGFIAGSKAFDFDSQKKQGRVFEGVDGKPRFEVDDSGAKLKNPNGKTLGEVLDHKELFNQYPELKNVSVIRDSKLGKGAEYNPSNDSIKLGTNTDKATLLHEVQHGIQQREGFAKGGSPEGNTIQTQIKMGRIKDNPEYQAFINKRNKLMRTDPDAAMEMEKNPPKSVQEYRKLADEMKKNSGIMRYKNLAGEAEARAVASRMNMTDGERYKSKKLKGYRYGAEEGQIGAGTFYNTKSGVDKVPDGESYKYPNEIAKDLEFNNPLILNDPELKIDGTYGYNPADFLANKWKITGKDGIDIEKKVAQEAIKRGYDGILYADNEIQDLRSLNPTAKPQSTFYDSLDVPKEDLIIRDGSGKAMSVDTDMKSEKGKALEPVIDRMNQIALGKGKKFTVAEAKKVKEAIGDYYIGFNKNRFNAADGKELQSLLNDPTGRGRSLYKAIDKAIDDANSFVPFDGEAIDSRTEQLEKRQTQLEELIAQSKGSKKVQYEAEYDSINKLLSDGDALEADMAKPFIDDFNGFVDQNNELIAQRDPNTLRTLEPLLDRVSEVYNIQDTPQYQLADYAINDDYKYTINDYNRDNVSVAENQSDLLNYKPTKSRPTPKAPVESKTAQPKPTLQDALDGKSTKTAPDFLQPDTKQKAPKKKTTKTPELKDNTVRNSRMEATGDITQVLEKYNQTETLTDEQLDVSDRSSYGEFRDKIRKANILRYGHDKAAQGLEKLSRGNKASRAINRVAQYLNKNAGQDPAMIEAAKKFGGENSYTDSSLLEFGQQVYGKLDTEESRSRVHAVLDPEARQSKLKMSDLTATEQEAANQLKELGDAINDTSYRSGMISKKKWKSNQNGKYIARLYQELESSQDVGEMLEIPDNRGLHLGMYKSRVEMNEDMRSRMLKDPVKLAVIRARQVRQNEALMNYMNTAESKGYVTSKPKDGYIKVGSGNRMGNWSGKYVRQDVYENIEGFKSTMEGVNAMNNVLDLYDGNPLRKLRKKLLTIYNPVVRTGNVTSNYFFAYLNGVNPATFQKNKSWAKKAMKSNDPLYIQAEKSGLIGNSVILSDKNLFNARKEFMSAVDREANSGVWNDTKRANERVTRRYGEADDIAKLSAMKTHIDRGMSVNEAIAKTKKGFQDYSRVGHAYDIGAKVPIFGNAFVRFQGDLYMNIIKNAAIDHPMRLGAMVAGTAALANGLSALSGEDEEDRKVRENRPGAPKIPFTNVSTEFQTPFGAVDVARFTPMYMRQGVSGNSTAENLSRTLPFNIPASTNKNDVVAAAASDPLIGPLISTAFDADWRGKSVKDPEGYRDGKELYPDDPLSTAEQNKNRLQYLTRSYAPYPANPLGDILAAYRGDQKNEQITEDSKYTYIPDQSNNSFFDREGYNTSGSKKSTGQSLARLLGFRAEQYGAEEAQQSRDITKSVEKKKTKEAVIDKLSTPARKDYESLHSYTKQRSGAIEFDEDLRYSMKRAQALLSSDELLNAEREIAQVNKEYDGKPLHPQWELPQDKLKQVLTSQTFNPGEGGDTKGALYDQTWYNDYKAKENKYYDELSAYNKEQGYDDYKPKYVYPEGSPQLQSQVESYYDIESTYDKGRTLASNPELARILYERKEYTNKKRRDLGLPDQPNSYAKYIEGTQERADYIADKGYAPGSGSRGGKKKEFKYSMFFDGGANPVSVNRSLRSLLEQATVS